MATPPFTINEAIPGDTDLISQHPANARTFRDVVESWLLTISDTSGNIKAAALSNVKAALMDASNTGDFTITGTATLPTVDIDAGAIDGTAIGASSASTIKATSLSIKASSPGTPASLAHIEGTETSTSAVQMTLEGQYTGYGAGIAMASKTSSGGTMVNMAKIVATGTNSWNTTSSTQDAKIDFWTAKNGALNLRAYLNSEGLLTATDFQAISDARLKTDFSLLDGDWALDMVRGKNGWHYTMKDGGQPKFGLLAQEFEDYPELVGTAPDGEHMSLNYNGAVAILWAAVRALAEKIDG